MTSRILTLLIAVGLMQAALAQNATLITTFTNPAPTYHWFGISLAAVGSDRVLVGSEAAGAYLFSTNGTLLTTFTNPTPDAIDAFGWSVAAVGSDWVLIGAYADDTGVENAGAAYLFSTNGTLLTTFNNPTPSANDVFGYSVAAVGSDRVLIGAYGDNTGASGAGAAYLFNTNGTLLTTITNPIPADSSIFGYSVSSVGDDRLLIGTPKDNTGAVNAGAAYLFSTNGTLLTTFTNPTPAFFDRFGESVAAVGSDRVLIGARLDDMGAEDTGAAYLFSTNGTLLTTFTKPSPVTEDWFGSSVAAVGSDRVLIGAYRDDSGATDAGSAYLFSTNGALLAIFTNPTPADSDRFGRSVAAVGNDRIIVGAYQDDTGAFDAGAAYLFALPPTPPTLAIVPATPGNTTISWAPNTPGFVLQETEALSPANWTNSLSGAVNPTLAPTTPPVRFFRVVKP